MLRWFARQFASVSPDPATLDHVPVNCAEQPPAPEARATAPGEGLTHREKLELAAARAGKPFECAADGLPRKVTKSGVAVVVGVKPAPVPEPPNVTAISVRKAR